MTTGEVSIRAVLAGQLGTGREQRKALVRGAAVIVESHQLELFTHSQMPDNLSAHPRWLLTGDSTLTPA